MQTILITGGTGFLGRRLGRYFRNLGNEVFLTGRNHDQNKIAARFSGCPVLPSDVANIESLRDAFAESRPNVVIHAAASKYVDTAEANPMECLDVNVHGSQNVARVSIEWKVETVVGISTDKAAPPVANTYGLTKALMERLYCAMNQKTSTKFACVRFGNMPWSTGSVFPIWKRMIEESGCISSTGSQMTRLFTPVEEAVEIIEASVKNIKEIQGKVLCRTMKSGLIGDFLRVWVEKKGGEWSAVPARAGERNFEHLIGETECAFTTEKSFDGVRYYLIDPYKSASEPLTDIVSSVNADRFSDQEIWEIIGTEPEDAV